MAHGRKRIASVRALIDRVVACRPGTAGHTQSTELWSGLEQLESRVLLSSSTLLLDTLDDGGGDSSAAVVQPVEVQTNDASGSAFARDARAMYLWQEQPIMDILFDEGAREDMFDFLSQKKITTLYLFAGQFFGTGPHPVVESPQAVAELIEDLHANGLQVFALLDSIRVDAAAPIVGYFQDVLDYNNDRPDFEQFDGFQLDIEPWQQPTWDFGGREPLSGQYLDLAQTLMDMKNTQAPDLLVGPSMPFWFDTFSIDHDQSTRLMNQHTQDIFDYTTILAFRDFALLKIIPPFTFRTDGIVSLTSDELTYAQQIGKPVVIGVETNRLGSDPISDLISFAQEGEVRMQNELTLVDQIVGSREPFGGFAFQDFPGLAGFPPEITSVVVSSTQWDNAFIDHLSSQGLGDGGYAIPTNSPQQLAPLPWSNMNQVKITFSEDVVVSRNSLTLQGTNVANYRFRRFAYDAKTFTATWTLRRRLRADDLQITLSDTVTDRQGNQLDGEWIDGVSAFLNGTGDGVPGGDFKFRFSVLPGDVDQSGSLDDQDLAAVIASRNTEVGDGDYTIFSDVDGSGEIVRRDARIVRRQIRRAQRDNTPPAPVSQQRVVNIARSALKNLRRGKRYQLISEHVQDRLSNHDVLADIRKL